MKTCTKCLREKPESAFYKNGKGFHSHCKTCLNEYYITRQRKLKEQAVTYKGGKCEKCGYHKCVAALEFHHKDPSQKDFSISTKATVHFSTIKIELDKCILVCKNCHAEIHYSTN